jgi:hypothetical protein
MRSAFAGQNRHSGRGTEARAREPLRPILEHNVVHRRWVMQGPREEWSEVVGEDNIERLRRLCPQTVESRRGRCEARTAIIPKFLAAGLRTAAGNPRELSRPPKRINRHSRTTGKYCSVVMGGHRATRTRSNSIRNGLTYPPPRIVDERWHRSICRTAASPRDTRA